MFQEQAGQFGVPECFDSLVDQLAAIIGADVIEHRTVQDAIKRLQVLLKKNRKGTLSSVWLSMNYGRFVLDAFTGVLLANKHTKPIVEAIMKEFERTSEAVEKATQGTKQETIKRLINQQRLEAFLESNPDVRAKVAGYLPESGDTEVGTAR